MGAGLLGLAAVAAAALGIARPIVAGPAYAPAPGLSDTLLERPADAGAGSHSALSVGAVVPGYLSSRGLPPVEGRITVTDTGLVFRSAAGSTRTFPLVGPIRQTAGRRWRASAVSLAYMDESDGRTVYVFRVDAGVFETDIPGPLLEVAAHPVWLDSLGATEWKTERPLVDARDSAALSATARDIAGSAYADSLYTLFGSPRAPIGLIGRRGRMAGRLGEYIASRDSLALDPGSMVAESQLRHTLAHELGHRWQARSPGQVEMLWWGVPPIRDPKRYGYADGSEHQAEAIAFAVNFLQTTASRTETPRSSIGLLDHYELLVPGTRTMVRYLALQPIYREHPLRTLLTTGGE